MKFRISLTGDLGSGKSTVTELLTQQFDVERVSTGTIQREMAKSMNMSIYDFNRYMETHPEIDKELDSRLAKYNDVEGNYIFDSRLAWHFVPTALSFYLKTAPEVSAKRVFEASREGESFSTVEETQEKLFARRQSEIYRYKMIYGLDITDMNNYDVVIDTTNITPTEVASKIIEAVEKNGKQ